MIFSLSINFFHTQPHDHGDDEDKNHRTNAKAGCLTIMKFAEVVLAYMLVWSIFICAVDLDVKLAIKEVHDFIEKNGDSLENDGQPGNDLHVDSIYARRRLEGHGSNQLDCEILAWSDEASRILRLSSLISAMFLLLCLRHLRKMIANGQPIMPGKKAVIRSMIYFLIWFAFLFQCWSLEKEQMGHNHTSVLTGILLIVDTAMELSVYRLERSRRETLRTNITSNFPACWQGCGIPAQSLSSHWHDGLTASDFGLGEQPVHWHRSGFLRSNRAGNSLPSGDVELTARSSASANETAISA